MSVKFSQLRSNLRKTIWHLSKDGTSNGQYASILLVLYIDWKVLPLRRKDTKGEVLFLKDGVLISEGLFIECPIFSVSVSATPNLASQNIGSNLTISTSCLCLLVVEPKKDIVKVLRARYALRQKRIVTSKTYIASREIYRKNLR